MRILEIAVLACVLAVLLALLAGMVCCTYLRLAEIRARRNAPRGLNEDAQNDGGAHQPPAGSIDEGFENIMQFSVNAKAGDRL